MFFLTRRTRRWLVNLVSLYILFIIFTEIEVQEPAKRRRARQKRERRVIEVWDLPPDDIIPPPFLERTRLYWGTNVSAIPSTKIHRHVPGWTLMDNVYVFKGTIYIVSDHPDRDRVPHIENMISSGKPIRNEPGDEHRREPTDQNMQVITSEKALQMFGAAAKRIEGTSVIIYEPSQYFANSFRFLAEIMFGLWRTYYSIDSKMQPNGQTILPAPQRIILPNIIAPHWRDGHGLIARLWTMAFPSAHIQAAETWSDFADLGNLAHICDRVILADRAAAARSNNWHDKPFAWLTDEFFGSPWWWEPMKRALIGAIGKEYQSVNEVAQMKRRPVITYIATQGYGSGAVHPDDHEDLVRQLSQLEGLYGYAIRVHQWNELTLQDQLAIGRESDILMAVHGEALLPFLWMPSRPTTSIIEFYSSEPETDLHEDYAWTASTLDISTYSFYGKGVAYKYPEHPRSRRRAQKAPDSHVRVDGNAVVALCVDILSKR